MRVNQMKYVVAVVVAMLLAGCNAPLDPVTGAPESKSDAYDIRSYDPTYGVVCYRSMASTGGPSCVKVGP